MLPCSPPPPLLPSSPAPLLFLLLPCLPPNPLPCLPPNPLPSSSPLPPSPFLPCTDPPPLLPSFFPLSLLPCGPPPRCTSGVRPACLRFSAELCALVWHTSRNLVEVMRDRLGWCHSAHELCSFVASSILWAVPIDVSRDAM